MPRSTRASRSSTPPTSTATRAGARRFSAACCRAPRPGRARDEVRQADGRRRRAARLARVHPRARSTRRSQRLQTDVIDLYQHHEEDPDTPLEETVGALDELVDAGHDPRVRDVELRAAETLERAKAIAGRALRLRAERVLVARARRRGRAAARRASGSGSASSRTSRSRAGCSPARCSRDTPPAEGTRLHGRAISRRASSTRSSVCARGRRRTVSSLLDVAIGGLLRGEAGRLGDRRRDEAGAGARERRSRRVGAAAAELAELSRSSSL